MYKGKFSRTFMYVHANCHFHINSASSRIDYQFSCFVFTQYENIQDESEGFLITDIEKHYNSDEESEGKYIHYIVCLVLFSPSLELLEKNVENAQQEQPVQHTHLIRTHTIHIHTIRIHNSTVMKLPLDVLLLSDDGWNDDIHTQHRTIVRRTKATPSNNDDDHDDHDDHDDANDDDRDSDHDNDNNDDDDRKYSCN